MVVMFRTKGNSCLEPLKFNTGVSRRRGPLGLSPGTGVTLSEQEPFGFVEEVPQDFCKAGPITYIQKHHCCKAKFGGNVYD
ncbi:MAG: hypothetical protein Ct9H90mP8_0850 [Pseudomonadota bacterium]|nr:MAG: hypothetical protein Ct9H90mP8_0850 [Pseudomonadota bacterium]